MSKIFVVSDTHFEHKNIIKFMDDKGEVIRRHPDGRVWNDVSEHDEYLVRCWNETVTSEDHVYHLGDFCINKLGLRFGPRLMGHKRLVRGNHDICSTKDYIDAGFKELYGVRVFEKHGLILSHIPLHPNSIKQGWVNVHGHLHSNVVKLENGHSDPRYRCVSIEHTNYKPILLLTT